ncbi:hypothetical protein BKK50_06175 [Rodentibacter rarus]|uniref:P68 RBP/TagC-like beta-propeller domain-containing protein n=1 Tax=Rodentibacter rarus TaxID=1908260 RepID=A0A1V3ILI5_9PAST|nr:hypothetical protein [Rodentibacter rarus]OOF42693.1 hypothetical protein BKK50_06175 [Rodentibacter rarus]
MRNLERRYFIKSCLISLGALFIPKELHALSLSYYMKANYFKTLQRIGEYATNVVQSFAIDIKDNLLFTQHVGGKEHNCYLCQYSFSTDDPIKASSYMHLKNVCGHQGISIQKIDSNILLWSSAGKLIHNFGLHGIRFNYIADSELTNYEVFKFFDEENFKSKGSTMPIISSDGKYLIARGYRKKDNISIIRIFDIKITEKQKDLSNNYLYQWEVSPISQNKEYPMQGIASNGNNVIIQLGSSSTTRDKALLIYSLDGILLNYTNGYRIGKNEALTTGDSSLWEPEGIYFSQDQNSVHKLFHCIASGNKGNRIVRIYQS